MSDYRIKADGIMCVVSDSSDGIAVLREQNKKSLTVFLWKNNPSAVEYKIRRVVGDSVQMVYSSDETSGYMARACKRKGREEIWFSSKAGASPTGIFSDVPNRSIRKNVVLDFSNAYMRVKAIGSLKVNQQVTGI
jgi:hypothetical protein